MKRFTLAASLVLAFLLPGAAAIAKPPSAEHVREYESTYNAVQHQFGRRAPGRNIVRWGFAPGQGVTDDQVVASLAVLRSMLAPPPASQSGASSSPQQGSSQSQGGGPSDGSSTGQTQSAGSGLAGCIVQRESGGNSQDVSGQYSGLANWSQEAWAQDGGTQYAASPTGATPSQQMSVLNSALASGNASQWTQFDGC